MVMAAAATAVLLFVVVMVVTAGALAFMLMVMPAAAAFVFIMMVVASTAALLAMFVAVTAAAAFAFVMMVMPPAAARFVMLVTVAAAAAFALVMMVVASAAAFLAVFVAVTAAAAFAVIVMVMPPAAAFAFAMMMVVTAPAAALILFMMMVVMPAASATAAATAFGFAELNWIKGFFGFRHFKPHHLEHLGEVRQRQHREAFVDLRETHASVDEGTGSFAKNVEVARDVKHLLDGRTNSPEGALFVDEEIVDFKRTQFRSGNAHRHVARRGVNSLRKLRALGRGKRQRMSLVEESLRGSSLRGEKLGKRRHGIQSCEISGSLDEASSGTRT